MSARDRARRLTIAALLLVTGGCFHTSAPPGWLPRPEEVKGDAFGAWARVERNDSARTRVEGELIAVDADSIHVLKEATFVSLGMAGVRSVTLTAFDQPTADATTWMVFGALSAGSHGLLAILTAPTWLAVGVFSVRAMRTAPAVRWTKGDVEALRKFARFPQGIPTAVDRAKLRPKFGLAATDTR